MSLPPGAKWTYGWRPAEGSKEERLYNDFLRPWIGSDWINEIERKIAKGVGLQKRRQTTGLAHAASGPILARISGLEAKT